MCYRQWLQCITKYWEMPKIKYTWRTDWICTTWHYNWGISSFCSPTTYGDPSSGMWKLDTRSKTQIIQEKKMWNSLQNSLRNPMPRLETGILPWNMFLFWFFWCNLNCESPTHLLWKHTYTALQKACRNSMSQPKNSSSSPKRVFPPILKLSGRQSTHKPPKGHGLVLICPFHYFFTSINYYFEVHFFSHLYFRN